MLALLCGQNVVVIAFVNTYDSWPTFIETQVKTKHNYNMKLNTNIQNYIFISFEYCTKYTAFY